jgi:hypothetical protein
MRARNSLIIFNEMDSKFISFIKEIEEACVGAMLLISLESETCKDYQVCLKAYVVFFSLSR